MLDKKPTEKKIVVDLDLLQQAKIYIDYANGVDLSVITWYRKGQIVYVDKLEAEHWRFVGLSNLYFAEEFLFTKKSEKNTMTDIDRETCERVKKEFKSLGTVDVNFLKNSQKDIIGFTANVTKANGVVEKLKFDIARIQSGNSVQRGYVFSGANLIDNNAGSNIQSALNKLQVYENKIAKLRVGFTSPATGIKDAENLSALTAQYNRIKSTIDQVRASNTSLSNEQRRGIIQNISNLELQISRYRDLQRVMATTNTRTLSANDISLYQGNMANRLASLQVGKETIFARPEIQAQVARLTADVARFGTVGGRSVTELNLQFAQLTTSVRSATAEITRINGAADSFLTTLTKNFGKMLAWGLVEIKLPFVVKVIM